MPTKDRLDGKTEQGATSIMNFGTLANVYQQCALL
jgi:hypothetical protein